VEFVTIDAAARKCSWSNESIRSRTESYW